MKNLEQRQWTQLAEAIRLGKCIVFLGPGATINYGNPHRQADFLEQLAVSFPNDIVAYHSSDGFLVFKDGRTRSLYETEIRDFYKEMWPNPMLELLARIPFHIAISVTPDQYLRDAFEKQGFAYCEQYYATKQKVPLAEVPTSARPLLYNIFGSVKAPQSILTSHADLFSCLQSIFGDKNLPDELTTLFNTERTKSIIFLGFEFDKWYFQLILHILGIKIDACWRYAVAQALPTEQNKTLFESEYAVEFVNHDMMAFLDRLSKEFAPEELRHRLDSVPDAMRLQRARVLQFVLKAFSAIDLEVFCMIHFAEVHQEFTSEMSQTRRVGLLIDYCDRHGSFQRLLDAGRAENPFQYDQCGPYHG